MYVYLYAKLWKDNITIMFFLYYNLIAPKFCNICCVYYVLAFEATSKARIFKL